MRLHSKGRVRQVTKSALTVRLHSKGRVRQVTKSALTMYVSIQKTVCKT